MSDFENFFGKVKDAVVKGATTVADKSEQLVEIGKHKAAILKLESQKNDAAKELGFMFYEMSIADSLQIEPLRAKCDNIATLDKEIAEHKAAVDQLEGKAPGAPEAKAPAAKD